MGKLFWFIVVVVVVIMCNNNSDKKKEPENRTYESSYNSSSTATSTDDDKTYIDNSLNTGNSLYQETQASIENNPYYNNSLSTGASPYTSYGSSATGESQISVSTSYDSNCDVVVIIKSGGNIARNAYIRAGGSHTFYLPNGTYQVFFYGGKGWNPNKSMPNGLKGGFVANESYSKDSPVSLEYQGLTYELIPQPNGNFSTKQSSASEIF